ncbi:hypothetical protein [Breznakia pachnodae]|uniref:Uncharacterized protein n=1 Tax=Breznakia pachnodae TaxID=265178 RepID=A0ABU0E4N8_9FIRM|nr:hypothetical protein [Breznakia pachnodae]MDQ0361854.1 hypothetical protein [Breznakia pachnodae]
MIGKDEGKIGINKKINNIVKRIAVIFLVGICLSCSSGSNEIVCDLKESSDDRNDTYWIQYDDDTITMYKYQIRLDYEKSGVPKEDLEVYANDIKDIYKDTKVTYSYKFEDDLFIETLQVKIDDNFEELKATGVFNAYINQESEYLSKEVFLKVMDEEVYTCK